MGRERSGILVAGPDANGAITLSRRRFVGAGLAAGGLAAGGLVFGLRLGASPASAAEEETATFDAWIAIGTDDVVTIGLSQSEMGQGVATALPMVVAEELDADWSKIRTAFVTGDPAYRNTFDTREALGVPMGEEDEGILKTVWGFVAGPVARAIGQQYTGGSTSLRMFMPALRRAGAAARDMLVRAAAEEWGAPVTTLETREGFVIDPATGARLSYGALAARAARLDPPSDPPLKRHEDFRLIGQPVRRLDIPDKVTGRTVFGIDVTVPGMAYAAVRTAPQFGGGLLSFDAAAIAGMPGVIETVALEDGVAVVADSTWRAIAALNALPVEWAPPEAGTASLADIRAQLREASAEDGVNERDEGDLAAALGNAAQTIEAKYELPYLAHATMEPMNATAHVTNEKCEVWAPTQAQTRAREMAAEAAGISEDRVVIHTTYLGGGFGRRAEADMIVQAVRIAKAAGRPVKLTWTREEDIRHDFYRPAGLGLVRGGLDAQGRPVAWAHKVVGPSILARFFPPLTWTGHDITATQGAIEMPYGIPNVRIDYVRSESPVPVGFWRSVGHSINAFVIESFIDELAHAAGRDPFEFRRSLLADRPRHRAVLARAAQAAGWGTPLPENRGRGIALHESFGSIVAEAAEVEIRPDGTPRVHKVVCAIDCGMVVNPAIVRAQMESGIIYGLTAALKGEIGIEDGAVVESNFHDYEMVRLAEAPEIETHIIEGGPPMGGVGECGTPPIAPAVANAIHAVTGFRIRALPIRNHALRRRAV